MMARNSKTVLAPVVAAIAFAGLFGCGGSEPATDSGQEGIDVLAVVKSFMKARQAGLPADEFLSADARAAYEEHASGLWLHDDTLPGGPGGEFRDFSSSVAPGVGETWNVEVRTNVEWLGDAPPSEMVEVLSVRAGVVVDAERTDDPTDDGLPLVVAETREQIY